MGYSVYWMYGRWQGYGVTAYCDYPGCNEIIDRGMGYTHEEAKEDNNVFCCNNHQHEPLESFEIDYDRECKEWLEWILSHESWDIWRLENPGIVEVYKKQLEKL